MLLLLMIDSQTMSRGLSIAVTGIAIVFAVLVLLSLFIAALPHLLAVVARVLPEIEHGHCDASHSERSDRHDDAVLAAIGFVLHTELQKAGNDGHSG